MKTLPHDVSRCSGRHFDSESTKCPERDTCKRFLAWIKWDADAEVGIPHGRGVPVTMGMRDCKIKIETIEVVE